MVIFQYNLYIFGIHLWIVLWGWSGGAKVLCILHHRGVQLILTYSWARPAVLVVGKGRGGMFFISSVSSLSFLFLFLPCPSLSSPLLSLLSLFSLSLGDDTKWPSRVDVSLNPNTIKWIVLYPKPCYNESCYKEVEVYVNITFYLLT